MPVLELALSIWLNSLDKPRDLHTISSSLPIAEWDSMVWIPHGLLKCSTTWQMTHNVDITNAWVFHSVTLHVIEYKFPRVCISASIIAISIFKTLD